MHSLSTLNNETSNNTFELTALESAGKEYFEYLSKNVGNNQLMKSVNDSLKIGYGSVNPGKGEIITDEYRTGFRGLRERFYNISFDILREIARKVVVISSIQNVRCMQLRPFSFQSYNDDDVGIRCKLKDKNAIPTKEDNIMMGEIEEFFLNCGYTDFQGSDEREDNLNDVLEMATRELLTIDQLAISLRRNKKGKLLDFWVLDGATVKRVFPNKGYMGDKKITYVQEIKGRIVETFTKDDIIFYYMNRRADILTRGYGYSYIEMCIDIITAWLFGMAYNKEFFNTSSMPKGFIAFSGDKVDQSSLEELQRQWISMFRGIKGMWRTPFLQYDAKWVPISQSNKDMEYNQYLQILSAWICAVHGIDAMELGMRMNYSGNVLNENQEVRLAYSKDRGLKDLLFTHQTWLNKIMSFVPEWKDYKIVFTGTEVRDKMSELEVDEKQTQVFMTINEKRKEKDMPPIKGGDVIANPTFIQNVQGMAFSGGMEAQQPEQEETIPKENEDIFEVNSSDVDKELEKSKDDFIEIILD